MKTVDIVIPAYIIDAQLVAEMTVCIFSLKKTAPKAKIIIVDNASPLLQEEMAEWADVYVRNDENRGYTAAVNQGVALGDGEIVVVANDDIGFTPGWLEALTDGLKQAIVSTCQTEELEKCEEGCKFGFLWAIDRKSWDTVGGLDEQFFNTFSDTDLWKRIDRMTVRVPHVVHHHGSVTLKKMGDRDIEYRESMEAYKAKHGELD